MKHIFMLAHLFFFFFWGADVSFLYCEVWGYRRCTAGLQGVVPVAHTQLLNDSNEVLRPQFYKFLHHHEYAEHILFVCREPICELHLSSTFRFNVLHSLSRVHCRTHHISVLNANSVFKACDKNQSKSKTDNGHTGNSKNIRT